MFCVVRHAEAGIGTVPAEAVELLRPNGWMRVSDYRDIPDAFHLSEFADAPDLDAAAPESDSPAEPDEQEE